MSAAEPSSGGGGLGAGWSTFEDDETLAAMDDDSFKRAVTRMLASQRKIFSSQARVGTFQGWHFSHT
jgi:hypothetical protein